MIRGRQTVRRRTLLRSASRLPTLAAAGALLGSGSVGCSPALGQPAGGPSPSQAQAPGGPASAGPAVRGGTFTAAVPSDAGTMQPLLAQDAASGAFTTLHYNAPLWRRNEESLELQTRYGTAESCQVSADGLTLTFKLKPRLQWSDGRPITAGDYAFTFERMTDAKVEYPFRAQLRHVASVAAPDDRTVVVRLAEAFCPAHDYTAFEPLPRHVFEKLDVNDNPHNLRPVVGSGPWLLQEWRRDGDAVFAANERFYLGRPHLDRYVLRVVKDQSAAYSMLKAGEIDHAAIPTGDWEDAKRQAGIQALSYYPAGASWTCIGFNLRHEALRDVRVRQGLAHAIDRRRAIDAIRQGHAKPINSIFASASWAFSDDVPKYEYDPARAKALLDAAGWRAPASDPNGTRLKDGKALRLRIFYNAGSKEREGLATIAQQYAKAVGVELDVIAEEWSAYQNRITRTRDMELYVLGWSAGAEPHGAHEAWITEGSQNFGGFTATQVDELLPKAASVPGCAQADRRKVYAEIQKLVAADPPVIFMWENESLSGLSARLVPNKLTRAGYGYRMWEWYSKSGA